MPTKYGFDNKAFSKATTVAAAEAIKVYHYGHTPDMPEEHDHELNGNCSETCLANALAMKASEHITNLEAVPDLIEDILNKYEGFEVVPAISDFLNQLKTKKFSLADTLVALHHNDKKECDCDDCKSGKTKKKFGIVGTKSGSPVTSVQSMVIAKPKSKVVLFGNSVYEKFADKLWHSANTPAFTYNEYDFLGAIQGNNAKWEKHLIDPDDEDKAPIEEAPQASDKKPWYAAGSAVKQNTMDMALVGSQIHEKYNNNNKYIKKANGKWQSTAWGSGSTSEHEYSVFTGNNWVWTDPKAGTPAGQAKVNWELDHMAVNAAQINSEPLNESSSMDFLIDHVESLKMQATKAEESLKSLATKISINDDDFSF